MSREHLLLLDFWDRDEIRMTILDICHLEKIKNYIDTLEKSTISDMHEIIDLVRKNEIERVVFQSYVIEPSLLSKYNIKTILHLPELAC